MSTSAPIDSPSDPAHPTTVLGSNHWLTSSWLTLGLLFSVGWGIRGNYGHETGAMLPGALGALGACLISRRSDWHRRSLHFALFGMLGWAFGGSISYMQVIGFTQSGHATTQLYGFAGLFVIGFLWAGLGCAATAVPAILDLDELRRLYRPLVAALLGWLVLYVFKERGIAACEAWLGGDVSAIHGKARHESFLYWLDSDWIEVTTITMALVAFYFVQRRAAGLWAFVAHAAIGGLMSYVLFLMAAKSLGNQWLISNFVQWQGDSSDLAAESALAVCNWPRLVLYLGQRQGIVYRGEALALWSGAIVGAVVYFWRHAQIDFGLKLLMAMAAGWWIGFLAMPVLGSLAFGSVGGFRMTPPRGDNWAGVLGTLVAALFVCWRHNYRGIVFAGLLGGLIGGLGLSTTACLEAVLTSYGNPNLAIENEVWHAWQLNSLEPFTVPSVPQTFEATAHQLHWQRQNWHSFLEQVYGFANGLAVLVTLAVLASRVPVRSNSERVEANEFLALFMAVPVLLYVNMTKNIDYWTSEAISAMPARMQAPWMLWDFSTLGWYQLFTGFTTLGLLLIAWRSRGTHLSFIPESWLGRGQLLSMLILWVFVLGNAARALPGFSEGRLLTEGIVFCNAVVASVLLLTIRPTLRDVSHLPTEAVSWSRPMALVAFAILILAPSIPIAETWTVRRVYGDARIGQRGLDYRFGPHANWKRAPLLRGDSHR